MRAIYIAMEVNGLKMDRKEAINLALTEEMRQNKKLICFGLGVNDSLKFFGTAKGLEKKFGSQRVFETPTSENAMTGIGIGMSLYKNPCVMMHQRLDFFLLAMDQLVNSAAKWHYMFGGQKSIPITIRLIVGKGWGQGPTHSQSLQSWFAHIPGLKVVMPSLPSDAYNLLKDSIRDPNPVIFITSFSDIQPIFPGVTLAHASSYALTPNCALFDQSKLSSQHFPGLSAPLTTISHLLALKTIHLYPVGVPIALA